LFEDVELIFNLSLQNNYIALKRNGGSKSIGFGSRQDIPEIQ
jgi:hypothetical protein